MARKRIRGETQNTIFVKSRRRCCLCFWLDGKDEVQRGQLAHLDRNNQNSAETNLVFLCLRHHDEYDSKTSTSKGLQEGEVRKWRDELYREMAYRFRENVEDQKRKETFSYLEGIMGDLLEAMRRGLKAHPLWRLVSIGPAIAGTHFVFGRERIPELWEKIHVLRNIGLLKMEQSFYILTEELVHYLRTS